MFKGINDSLSILSDRARLRYWFLVIARVVINLLDALAIALVGALGAGINGSLDSLEVPGLNWALGFASNEDFLALLAASVIFLFVIKSLASSALLAGTMVFLSRQEAKHAKRISDWLMTGPLPRLNSLSKPEILWATQNSAHFAVTGVLSSVSSLISEASLFVMVFALFLVVDPTVALSMTLYFVAVFLLYQRLVSKRLKALGERIGSQTRAATSQISDQIANFREIKISGVSKYFLESFAQTREVLAREMSLQNFFLSLPRYFVEVALMLGVGGLLTIQLFVLGDFSSWTNISVILAGGLRLTAALLPLQNSISNLKILLPQARQSQELKIEYNNDTYQSHNSKTLESEPSSETFRGPLKVELREITFCHLGSDRSELTDICLSVDRGTHLAITGPSGAGKSTLVDLLLGLLSPNSGKALLEGIDASRFVSSHPGMVAYVPQVPGVLTGTLAQNVALGVEGLESYEVRIMECLREVGLSEWVSELDKGIWSDLGKHGVSISGGQRQKLGLARALFSKPSLLVLDEVTSGLDKASEDEVLNLVSQLKGNVTVIAVTHKLSTIKAMDQVAFLRDGTLSSPIEVKLFLSRRGATNDF